MAQYYYKIVVPKFILEGTPKGEEYFTYEVTAKDKTQAIKRAREKAIESGNFSKIGIDTDWRWERLKFII